MAKTPFTLKSGNKLGASTFKMMGSSSPMHQEKDDNTNEKNEKLSAANTKILDNLKINKTNNVEENADAISEEYGGVWKRDPRKLFNPERNEQVIANQWKNEQNQTVLTAAEQKQLVQDALKMTKKEKAAHDADREKYEVKQQ